MKKDKNEVEIKTIKAVKPVLPKIYIDGGVNMPSSMITTKEKFFKIWKGAVNVRDIDKAWEKAKTWKDSFRK